MSGKYNLHSTNGNKCSFVREGGPINCFLGSQFFLTYNEGTWRLPDPETCKSQTFLELKTEGFHHSNYIVHIRNLETDYLALDSHWKTGSGLFSKWTDAIVQIFDDENKYNQCKNNLLLIQTIQSERNKYK